MSYCKYLGGLKPITISLEYALYKGFQPCPYCKPDEVINKYYNTTYYDYTWIIVCIVIVVVIAIIVTIILLYKKRKKQGYPRRYNNLPTSTLKPNTQPKKVIIQVNEKEARIIETSKLKQNEKTNMEEGYKHINREPMTMEDLKAQITSEENEVNGTFEEEKTELPMNWYKFWIYVRLPLSILMAIGNICSIYVTESSTSILPIVYYAGMIAYFIFLMYVMIKRKKGGFELIVGSMILSAVVGSVSQILDEGNNIFSLFGYIIITFVMWIIPNYRYFKKRKDIFIN